jgi:hypothetical protein
MAKKEVEIAVSKELLKAEGTPTELYKQIGITKLSDDIKSDVKKILKKLRK